MTRKDDPLLSSLQTCKGRSLSRREIERTNEGVKRAINCQAANSLRMIEENPSTQRKNEPESYQGRLLAENGITKASRFFTELLVHNVQNRPREDSNFEISYTFDRYCNNKTTTSLTAMDADHVI